MAISFQNSGVNFRLKNILKTRQWIKKICSLEKKEAGDINFIFMNDDELLKYNEQYLKHDTFTDIITFDYSAGYIISGDIMISIDRVTENAAKYKSPFETELKRVIIHGILHLCGYTDKTKARAEEMRKKEDWALRKL